MTNETQTTAAVDLASTFATARARVGMKHESLARLMGIPAPQLSQQLAGDGHVSLRRLLGVAIDPDGRTFLQELWPLLSEQVGFDGADPAMAALGHALESVGSLIVRMKVKVQQESRRQHAA
jgi:DNA-binding transcriptional regulator YdaS (Cro superfamily)